MENDQSLSFTRIKGFLEYGILFWKQDSPGKPCWIGHPTVLPFFQEIMLLISIYINYGTHIVQKDLDYP